MECVSPHGTEYLDFRHRSETSAHYAPLGVVWIETQVARLTGIYSSQTQMQYRGLAFTHSPRGFNNILVHRSQIPHLRLSVLNSSASKEPLPKLD